MAFLRRSMALSARVMRATTVTRITPLRTFSTPAAFHSLKRAFGDAESSALSTPVSIRNGSRVQGRLDLQLPLPGVAGLTPVHITDETCTVQDLVDTIKSLDPSLKTVEVTAPNGAKLARTVQLNELTSMEFILRLNHVNILISNYRAKEDASDRAQNVGFATIKAQIEKDSRQILPLDEYYQMCLNAGGEEPVANKWLRELQRRNLVAHFDKSKNTELKNAIILRPHSSESILTLQNALDSELYNIKHDRKVKEAELKNLQSELKKALAVDTETRKAAQKLPNAQKWVSLAGITSFYGSLMYCVWDVYSWDVMEPITYFISFTAVLGNSFYHTIAKKDATYSNIWQKGYQARLMKINAERKHNPAKIQELEIRIADVERDLQLLEHWAEPSPLSK